MAWEAADTAAPALQWRGAEPMLALEAVRVPGCGCAALRCQPPPRRDGWCRTFYMPELIVNDAAALVTAVPADVEATATVDVALVARHTFDQGGIFIHVDDGCFVKAGLEVVDGVPRLSVVVTNHGWSDWSTQPWPHGPRARVRVHKLHRPLGACILVEADTAGAANFARCPSAEGAAAAQWSFVRIAPLHAPAGAPWYMGAYAASPIAAGLEAKLQHLTVARRTASLSHDSNLDVHA